MALKKVKFKNNMVVVFDSVSDSGSSPKFSALDLDLDNKWSIKWGDEVHTEVVGSRLFSELGFDVDHPYYSGKDDLTVVFADPSSGTKNAEDLVDQVKANFGINIRDWISRSGIK